MLNLSSLFFKFNNRKFNASRIQKEISGISKSKRELNIFKIFKSAKAVKY